VGNIYDYLCELKEKSKSQKCGMKRPNGNKLDKIVCEEIKKLSNDKSEFMTILKNQHKKKNVNDESYLEKVKSLRKSKTETEAKIKTLVQSLTQSEGTPAQGYILQGINVLDEMVKKLESQIAEYENLAKTDNMSEEEFQKLAEIMTSFAAAFENMSAEQKRMAIRAFVRKVIWDGENVHIYFFGADEDKIDLSDIDNGEPQGEYSK